VLAEQREAYEAKLKSEKQIEQISKKMKDIRKDI